MPSLKKSNGILSSKEKHLFQNQPNKNMNMPVSEREYYYDLMKKEGVSGKDEFQAQTEILGRSEAQIPNIERANSVSTTMDSAYLKVL